MVASLFAVASPVDASVLVIEPSPHGPTTLEVLTARPADLVPPPLLVAPAETERELGGTSRSSLGLERGGSEVAPECDGVVTDIGTNGRVPVEELCDLWQAPYRDRADAVVSIVEFNAMYEAKYGEPMCLSSAYRTREEQAVLRRQKPGLAAPAGLSNHGWGLAVDLCPETYAGERGRWLTVVGDAFGWENPAWARRGGAGPYEPWHWEYEPGVRALEGVSSR